MPEPTRFIKLIIETGPDQRSRFREETIDLDGGTPELQLSETTAVTGLQFRQSPIGYRTDYHCAPRPQWMFVLSGELAIGLRDGTNAVLRAGDHLYSSDVLPEGADFDPAVHGHNSWQVGDQPVVTAFVAD
ncbi:hypothetical protein [Rhodococcus opacus]|uniref:hypothetical protein n=1 Tax=Rhodococcus opacus TaxID=37919 RepID=UPI001C45CCED|nr:hypothetical protein [Rhodococcus opacus]MBV6756707.1 hypothetical protein [Rhodococcus opacus]